MHNVVLYAYLLYIFAHPGYFTVLITVYSTWLAHRYLKSAEELVKFAACMHLRPSLPSAVVVLDITAFAEAQSSLGGTTCTG